MDCWNALRVLLLLPSAVPGLDSMPTPRDRRPNSFLVGACGKALIQEVRVQEGRGEDNSFFNPPVPTRALLELDAAAEHGTPDPGDEVVEGVAEVDRAVEIAGGARAAAAATTAAAAATSRFEGGRGRDGLRDVGVQVDI